MTTLELTISIVTPAIIIILMFVRLEHRLTKIETNVSWITKSLNSLDKEHKLPDTT